MTAFCGARTAAKRSRHAGLAAVQGTQAAQTARQRVAPMVPEIRAAAQRPAGAGAVKPVTNRERRVNGT
ncbi:hypothetical protein FSO04_40175 [Paraburkholderia madseniana]|uniref:Uncharacterized protein n=1 Tax=Paraburkholderia madseniana TaxID=2599607 RepID=A0A6N6W1N7_9BURK|nr:hypothetical protein [Paraburkholderia madseniana]KAE8754343.1 hypothetical protein FSO04_40175 [Paraburkholderia madseniana]MCX4171149.1 hypothetical protein [Paraburkholderia madseniana]MDQ6459161.1 hypothetical protein [Paraburkholderia madseniana]NPT70668.1 hypothetical protein [Paraburkholderia madseniana]